MQIRGTTKLLGVIGDPVKHSFSPLMHNAAIAKLGVDYVYLAFPISADQLSAAIAGFWTIGLEGFNITIPHKQRIIPLLEKITPEAELIGAVNTVWRTETGWQGTNTDIIGFIAPLQQLTKDWSQVTPVILGNGGAARAVVVGCHQLGCQQIQIVGRNTEKLTDFLDSWQNTSLASKVTIHPWESLSELIAKTDLLVNTTPIGMFPKIDNSPVPEAVLCQLKPRAIAYDLIYTPSPTKFLQLAQKNGAMAIDGLEMLVQQGAAALTHWLSQPVPIETMRQALLEHLKKQDYYSIINDNNQ